MTNKGEQNKEKNYRMSQIRSKNSKIEKKLRSALWLEGYRYKIHYKKLAGSPDIVFVRQKIAIFCDSEFWHGYKWKTKKRKIDKIFKKNIKFWTTKIQKNIARDKAVNMMLTNSGWIVIRFWGQEIENELEKCVSLIEAAFRKRVGQQRI